MQKVLNLLKKLGIELTTDQDTQVKEVIGKKFVAAEDAAKKNTELNALKNQLEQRNADLEKFKRDTTSADRVFGAGTSEIIMNGGCYLHVPVRFIYDMARYFKKISNQLTIIGYLLLPL